MQASVLNPQAIYVHNQDLGADSEIQTVSQSRSIDRVPGMPENDSTFYEMQQSFNDP